jgi:hypothetical protein
MATRQLTVIPIDPSGVAGVPQSVESAIWFPSDMDTSRYNRFLTLPHSQRWRIQMETGFPANPGIAVVMSEDRRLEGRERLDTLMVLFRELVVTRAAYLRRVYRINVL